jgi:hypothetical protein
MTATPVNVYGDDFRAALSASVVTDNEFLEHLSKEQLMLAYGIIASPDRIQGATGPRRTALALMLWKACGSFRLTQGVTPDENSIMSAWQFMIDSYKEQQDGRSQAMLSRLEQDVISLKQFFQA